MTEHPENWGRTPHERIAKFVYEWRRLMTHSGRDSLVYELHPGGDRWCGLAVEDLEALIEAGAKFETVLGDTCYAAARQLAGMGNGREPSERLTEAFDAARELLGRDPTELASDPAGNDPR
jgi:hypothetical protein